MAGIQTWLRASLASDLGQLLHARDCRLRTAKDVNTGTRSLAQLDIPANLVGRELGPRGTSLLP